VSSPHSVLRPVAQRLSILIPRLGSNHDGEVVATVRAVCRTLESAKADLHDLAAVVRLCGVEPRSQAPPHYARRDDPPDHLTAQNWHQVARWLQRQPGLNEWEKGFLKSILGGFSALSVKQHACLAKIWNKRRRAAA
jgi:hypothetical protein